MQHTEQWVIYDHPTDYPDNFVLRGWTLYKGHPFPVQPCILVKTLEEARALIPAGFVRTSPLPNDDPVIAEVWV